MGTLKKAGVSIFLLFAAAAAGLVSGYLSGSDANAAPRPVTPRGELHADEKATIELFDKSKASVVFISTRENAHGERIVRRWVESRDEGFTQNRTSLSRRCRTHTRNF